MALDKMLGIRGTNEFIISHPSPPNLQSIPICRPVYHWSAHNQSEPARCQLSTCWSLYYKIDNFSFLNVLDDVFLNDVIVS